MRLMPKHIPTFCAVFGVQPADLGVKAGPAKRGVPADYVDVVSEAVIDAAVVRSALEGKKAQALRQQLRYAASKAKAGIGL